MQPAHRLINMPLGVSCDSGRAEPNQVNKKDKSSRKRKIEEVSMMQNLSDDENVNPLHVEWNHDMGVLDLPKRKKTKSERRSPSILKEGY